MNTIMTRTCLILGLLICNSCRDVSISPPDALPSGNVIYASMMWNGYSTWALDPNTLEPFSKMTTSHAIGSYVDRPDSAAAYGIVIPLGSENGSLVQLNPITSQIVFIDSTRSSLFTVDKDKKYLISYNWMGNPITIYDIQTKRKLHTDSSHGSEMCVASPVRNEIYLAGSKSTYNTQSRTFDRILIFDLTTFSVTSEIPIGNRGKPIDMQISPDGKTLFLTVGKSYQNGDEFLVIDIDSRSFFQVQYRIGLDTQIGVNKTGDFVYLTDPVMSLVIERGLPKTNRVLRYNVANRTMEVFIQNAAQLGLQGELRTQDIWVAPDNRTIFINTVTSNFVGIVKVDATTGRLIGKSQNFSGTNSVFAMQSGILKR
jgi:DNA-binding beta-propeller fold protein YncE